MPLCGQLGAPSHLMHIQARARWHPDRRSLLKTRVWTRELIASQAGQLQSGGKETPPCLPRSKASFFLMLCLCFVLRSVRTIHKKSLPLLNLFSLFTHSDLAAFWQLIQFQKEIMCLIGLLGVFFKWGLTHPHTAPRSRFSGGWAVLCVSSH